MSKLQPKGFSNLYTLLFMVVLSALSAIILSALASALKEPKEIAKDLDRSKQMMIAAKIFDANGYFTIREADGKILPAKYIGNGLLTPDNSPPLATQNEILEVYQKRINPKLTNHLGEIKTFEELAIDESKYLSDFKKSGFYKEPWKLFYEIMPNSDSKKPMGYVFPVNGFGLWDAIYGYIAIATDGDTVIGISWYDQKETPGLGANIADPPWQSLFPGKKIFLESPDGSTDFKSAPIGITVVKGKVSEVLGQSSKAKSAVDGMAGATLTGNGVTDAYRDVLSAYRPLLLKIHQEVKP